ncbi:DUF2207 domain-containing protein [Homoserinimonas hongtaonis]|uniref:DUF2207 domain-containing protein n=1 Tax=Homoserinimonas hongtaonis TaxID=2079791 RepID=UPI000D3864AD|nr:DUF2207 domain-containing protein [Salinibacterium hongtaonis]AWB88474.1 DUF2207 domain-containing protein [Salinibacterium hongtaonis]
MKRLVFAGVAVVGLLIGFAPASSQPAVADVDDFTFSSFDAQYYLGVDDEGHSTLRTVETLVAEFPEYDQNRGIRRLLVESYDGHPTDLEVVSVTDEAGETRDYETESDDDALSVTIAADDYVHGSQTYVIEYTQRNVTINFEDVDEFYWDVNGTDWAQPFERVSATVHVDPEIEGRLTGAVTAVYGSQGQNNPAEIDGLTFVATDLPAHSTLTFAIGFEPGTFTPRDSSFFAAPWPSLSLAGLIGAAIVTLSAFVVRRRYLADAQGRGIIVPEYAPPKGVSLPLAALIGGVSSKVTPAQIIALAVAHHLRVVETGTKMGKPRYRLEFLSAEGANDHEREFLHALFGSTLTPGEHRDLDKADQKAAAKIAKLQTRVAKEATEDGYRRKYPTAAVTPIIIVALFALGFGVLFAIVSLDQAFGGVVPLFLLLGTVALTVITIVLISRIPLTEKGVAVRDHMKGLKEYISLAEADRLRYLQSPQGALRDPIAVDDPAQVVKLNEKLLPYAMLFGLEKQWAKELGRFYEEHNSQPDWYVGSAPFNAAVFASSIGSVATSTASSYSSASSGSSGGASAGGGGGGGGGGGV